MAPVLLLAVVGAALGATARPVRRVAASPAAVTPSGALTLVYGDDHVFGVVPPAGWVVDDSSGIGSRIRVVLYPRGQKWSSAPTVMYANPLHQERSVKKPVAQMIERDIQAFRRAQPKGKVVVAPLLRTLKGQTAEVRYFAPDGRDPSEAVAYISEENLVMLLVLASREPGGFKQALPAFEQFVKHYEFVGGGIETPTSR